MEESTESHQALKHVLLGLWPETLATWAETEAHLLCKVPKPLSTAWPTVLTKKGQVPDTTMPLLPASPI